MPDPIARTYLSLGAFYASAPARRGSRERDVGLFWRSRRGPTLPRRVGARHARAVSLPARPRRAAAAAACTCSRRRLDEAELDRRLAGWEDVCGREGSLEWLLARMGSEPEPEPPATGRRFRRGRRGLARIRRAPPASPA